MSEPSGNEPENQAENTVGLRQMRQDASGLVRRAEGGEKMTITVAGRPAAVLGPVTARSWRRWEDFAEVLAGQVDADWAADRQLIDDSLTDPGTVGE